MVNKTITNQAIALAGITQVSSLVHQLATTGTAVRNDVEASLASVLKIDAPSVDGVYGSLAGVKHGLQQLVRQFQSAASHSEQMRCTLGLMLLEKQLADNPAMQKTIRIGVEQAQAQAEHFGVAHDNVVANLADLYQRTISTMEPRIIIRGEQEFLGNPQIVNKIRALLLAGIRSTLLWRQCGGTRWKLLLFQSKLQNEVHRLLVQLES